MPGVALVKSTVLGVVGRTTMGSQGPAAVNPAEKKQAIHGNSTDLLRSITSLTSKIDSNLLT